MSDGHDGELRALVQRLNGIDPGDAADVMDMVAFLKLRKRFKEAEVRKELGVAGASEEATQFKEELAKVIDWMGREAE